MKRFPLVALVLVVILTLSDLALAQTPAPAQAGPASAPQGKTAPASRPAASVTPAGNAETGRKLFTSYGCYQCHGYEAQGSSATGPRLGPRPMPFAGFSGYVRQPTGQMPPYTTKVVSDADLAHIHAFLQALPAPPPVQSLPLLK
jgi:ubiquinol-cytochrome c reductase cytochrome c subunit